MKEMDLDRPKRGLICKTTESKRIITTSEKAGIEMFCHVVSEVLDRLTQADGAVLAESMHQQSSNSS